WGSRAAERSPRSEPVTSWQFGWTGSGIEALLECARRGEFRRLAGRDADRLTGSGVPSLPRGPVADAELAKAGKRDLPPGGQLIGDRVDRRLHHLPSLAGGKPVAPRDLLG